MGKANIFSFPTGNSPRVSIFLQSMQNLARISVVTGVRFHYAFGFKKRNALKKQLFSVLFSK